MVAVEQIKERQAKYQAKMHSLAYERLQLTRRIEAIDGTIAALEAAIEASDQTRRDIETEAAIEAARQEKKE